MHPDEERLQRLRHGELFSERPGEPPVREHVAACAECRERLARMEREEADVHGLLALLDHPAPEVSAGSIVDRARGRQFGAARWAAGLLVALAAAGAAYAFPGSPLRDWARQVVQWARPAPEPSPPAPAPELAGIAILPGDSLTILFTAADPDSRIRILLDDAPEVRVRAPLEAASFSSDAARLVVDNSGPPATFEIGLPRTLPRVEVRVADRTVFLKEESRITADVGGIGDTYVLPLAPAPGSQEP